VGATWQFALDGRAKPMEVPLAKTSAAKFLRKGTVQSVDYAAKHVNLQFGVLPYDHLVLACGAVSDPSTIPGLEEHCVDLTAKKDFADDIERFLDSVDAGGKTKRVVISITKCPYKCPPLPFEVACLIDDAAKRRGKGVRDAVSITVTSPVPWPFGGPKAKKAFTEAMAAKNITYLPETQVTSVGEQDGRKLVKTSGDELIADLVLATFPHRAVRRLARVYLWGWRTGGARRQRRETATQNTRAHGAPMAPTPTPSTRRMVDSRLDCTQARRTSSRTWPRPTVRYRSTCGRTPSRARTASTASATRVPR
jgi:sulfide:quinone oxidoreductase